MNSFFHHLQTDIHYHPTNHIAQTFHIPAFTDGVFKHLALGTKGSVAPQPIRPVLHFQPIKTLFQPVAVAHHPAPPQNSHSQPEQPKAVIETLKPDIQSSFSNFLESDTSYIIYGLVGLGVIVYIFRRD